jgi:general nucleoside transport system permease protein
MTADWIPLLGFPIEWAALSLFVAGCLYWERSGLSGVGAEGCILSSMLGLMLGYEWTGSYALASLIAIGFAVSFALITGGILLTIKADPAVGSFALTLIPACALGLLMRAGPVRLLRESPPPGLIGGTSFNGTYAEDFLASPWFWAAPVALAVASFVLLRSPYGLRLRAYGETPTLGPSGRVPVPWVRLSGAVLGALWMVPGAALLLRRHPDAPPLALGYIALACAIAGRWTFAAGILLAAGPAFLRTLHPYAQGLGGWELALEAAPFLLALLYVIALSRRALRVAATPQSRLDPDVL